MEGKIAIDRSDILITPDADVSTKLRRLWALAPGRATIRRRLTHDVARDVLWFLDRWRLEIDDADLAQLMRLAGEAEAQERTRQAILSGERRAIPPDLAEPLRPYQATGVALALAAGGMLIADDLGLGKTAQGIGVIAGAGQGPALVVCPTQVQQQWASQVKRFAPALSVHVARTASSYTISPRQCQRGAGPVETLPGGLPDVLVLNYEKLHGWTKLAGAVKVVVFDEVQNLRNNESRKYAAAATISGPARWRLGLSATPIHNYGDEIWKVFEILRPGALGTYTEFCQERCRFDGRHQIVREPEALGRYLRKTGAMIRRTKAEVGRELPGLQRCFQPIAGDPDVFAKVDSSVALMAQLLLASSTSSQERFRAAGQLDLQLRQATGIAKAPEVAAFVEMLLETRPKVVISGWHHAVVDIWRETLRAYKPVCITGRETAAQKEAARVAFAEGDSRVLILGLRAGAGIDGLQYVCSDVVHGELSWTPVEHEQIEGRLDRDGQKEPVTSWYLVTEHGADPVMQDVLGLKAGQVAGIRSPDEAITVSRVEPDRIKKLAEEVLRRTQGARGPGRV